MAKEWVNLPGRETLAARVYQRDRLTDGYLCPRCMHPIDWELPYRDPDTNQVNPWYKSADHIIELQDGGSLTDIDNMETVHLRCNSSKGAARRWERNTAAVQQIVSVDAYAL